MAHRVIGQEQLGFGSGTRSVSSLETLSALIDWSPVMTLLAPVHASAKGEAAWTPLSMFQALLRKRPVTATVCGSTAGDRRCV
jgi:hypothetical protein